MIVSLVEVFENTKVHSNEKKRSYSLRKVYINPEQVVCLREDVHFKSLLMENKLPEGLDTNQSFTRIYLNRGQTGIDVVVVGAPQYVEKEMYRKNKSLLRD